MKLKSPRRSLYFLSHSICLITSFLHCSTASESNGLFLTPLIEAGKINEAQKLAQVRNIIPNDNVLSYSGFITVNKEYNTNLFFWYFPAIVSLFHTNFLSQKSIVLSSWSNCFYVLTIKNNAESAPVLLFNDGGPGACLLNALLAYVGPYKYNPNQKVFEHRKSFAWNENFHVIFLDNPAGVGIQSLSLQIKLK